MIDLPEMAPCLVGKYGRHALAALDPSDAGLDLTLFCEHCGLVRRLPMSGEISAPLDALSATEILVAWASGEPLHRVRDARSREPSCQPSRDDELTMPSRRIRAAPACHDA